jgi:hypothetical protein
MINLLLQQQGLGMRTYGKEPKKYFSYYSLFPTFTPE